MPKFNLAVPHTLTKEDALERLQGFSQKLQEKYSDQLSDLEQQWSGDELQFSFKTFGFKIGGKLLVEENQIAVDGDLPIAAMMAKGKITSAIQEQLEKIMR